MGALPLMTFPCHMQSETCIHEQLMCELNECMKVWKNERLAVPAY